MLVVTENNPVRKILTFRWFCANERFRISMKFISWLGRHKTRKKVIKSPAHFAVETILCFSFSQTSPHQVNSSLMSRLWRQTLTLSHLKTFAEVRITVSGLYYMLLDESPTPSSVHALCCAKYSIKHILREKNEGKKEKKSLQVISLNNSIEKWKIFLFSSLRCYVDGADSHSMAAVNVLGVSISHFLLCGVPVLSLVLSRHTAHMRKLFCWNFLSRSFTASCCECLSVRKLFTRV